jgi:hypothetical protein
MKTMLRLLQTSVFYLVLCFTCVRAQNTALPPLPPGPLIQKHAPDFARWTVTIQNGTLDAPQSSSGPGGTGNAPPIITTFTKTGPILNVAIPAAGKTYNVWNVGSVKTMVDPEQKTCGPIISPSNSGTNPFDFDFSQSDFAGLEWISLDCYFGIKTFMGKKCIFFKADANEAYIDFETRLPVGFQGADGAHIFQFMPPPTEMLALPPVVKHYLDQRREEATRYTPVHIAPF